MQASKQADCRKRLGGVRLGRGGGRGLMPGPLTSAMRASCIYTVARSESSAPDVALLSPLASFSQ